MERERSWRRTCLFGRKKRSVAHGLGAFRAVTLAVSLFGKLSEKAGDAFLILALASGMTEWSLFHLRILPGKAGVYAFFVSVPLFFLAESISAVFCAKAAFNAVLQSNSH